MLFAKRQHEERESVSSLFFMRQKKKFESELKFAAPNSPIQLLPLHAHFGLPWSLHLHYLNFRHIVYVYTSSIRRIFYVFFSLYPHYLPLPPSLFLEFFSILFSIFLEFFLEFFSPYVVYFQNFFGFFLEFFSIYTIYVVAFSRIFPHFPLRPPKKFFLSIQYICSSFLGFFPIYSIYIVYMQYICSSFSFCLTSYYAHHPLGRRAMTIRSEFRELRSLHSSPSWSIRTKVLGFFYIVLYIVYTQYICSIICSILFFI